MTNGSNSSTEGVVGVDDRFGRRAVAAVELRQVVKEALFGEVAVAVVNRLRDDPFERDVQRLPALVIVLERFGEVTGSDGGIVGRMFSIIHNIKRTHMNPGIFQTSFYCI